MKGKSERVARLNIGSTAMLLPLDDAVELVKKLSDAEFIDYKRVRGEFVPMAIPLEAAISLSLVDPVELVRLRSMYDEHQREQAREAENNNT